MVVVGVCGGGAEGGGGCGGKGGLKRDCCGALSGLVIADGVRKSALRCCEAEGALVVAGKAALAASGKVRCPVAAGGNELVARVVYDLDTVLGGGEAVGCLVAVAAGLVLLCDSVLLEAVLVCT